MTPIPLRHCPFSQTENPLRRWAGPHETCPTSDRSTPRLVKRGPSSPKSEPSIQRTLPSNKSPLSNEYGNSQVRHQEVGP